MGQIISGHVFYSRKTKPGDYEHEQADVRLDFNLEDGEAAEAFVASVGVVAKIRAHAILNGATKSDGKTAALPPQLQTTAATTGKDKLVAEAAAAAGAPKTGTAEAAPAKTAAKKPPATRKVEPEPRPEPRPGPEPEVEDTADDDADMAALLGAAPAEITDADMVAKVTATNARIKDPGAIKKVIGKYVEFPKGCRDIPQTLRHQASADLDALQAKPAA